MFCVQSFTKGHIFSFSKLKKKRKEIKKLVTKKKKEKWNLILKIYLEKVLFYAQVYLFKNVENAKINALIIHQNWAKYSSWCNIFSERDMPFILILEEITIKNNAPLMKSNNCREYTVYIPDTLRFAVLKQQELSVWYSEWILIH